ncbi:MAG: efflux RND transporter periplasmic adaptor subunit [Anaerolineales bacterium]|nr:efflux RND transporter periplasmic adaptor subunit [Anaerolineales bacterium]
MQKIERFSFLKKLSRKTIFIMLFVALAIIAGVVFFGRSTSSETAAPVLQTAKVRAGDLIVSAIGAGNIVPAAQVDLTFRTDGVLTELNVAVGDAVTTGKVLARLDENLQAEVNFQALFSPESLAQAEMAFVNAQNALNEAEYQYVYFIGTEAWYWEQQLEQDEAALLALDANASQAQKDAAQEQVDVARDWWNYWQKVNMDDLAAWYKVYDIKNRKVTLFHLVYYEVSDLELASARADFESAKVSLRDAQAALEIIKAGPGALTTPIATLGPQMDRLEQARLAVERTRLTAPFDGTVTSLNMSLGQTVGTSPVLTLATTDHLLARFYLDETDLNKAAVGNPVIITLDAYPDSQLAGQVVMVEPALQIVDGAPAVVVWAELPLETESAILSGMTVEVEVIAGEARNALLVPIQALHELSPGSFAVFVIQADGQLVTTPVTVSLRDFANAEITSGLKVGDLVSTSTAEIR